MYPVCSTPSGYTRTKEFPDPISCVRFLRCNFPFSNMAWWLWCRSPVYHNRPILQVVLFFYSRFIYNILMILLIFLVTCFFIIPTILFSGNVQLKFQLIIRNINLSTFFSTLDQLFSASLTVIFFCILLYRFSYFRVSTDFLRFILLLFFFYLSIIILIHHRRGLILFLGWDGLGVTSYLLVCYYFNWKSLNGAMVTLMTNRIGDVCLF